MSSKRSSSSFMVSNSRLLRRRNQDETLRINDRTAKKTEVPERKAGTNRKRSHLDEVSPGRWREYPTPLTVCISLVSNGASTLLRSRLINVSRVLPPNWRARPHTVSINVPRGTGLPSEAIRQSSSKSSVRVRSSALPPR
jgi:hypothetical protein